GGIKEVDSPRKGSGKERQRCSVVLAGPVSVVQDSVGPGSVGPGSVAQDSVGPVSVGPVSVAQDSVAPALAARVSVGPVANMASTVSSGRPSSRRRCCLAG